MALRACAGVRACASIGGHRSLRSVHVCHAQIPDVNLTRRGVAGALAVSLVIATQPQPAQALGFTKQLKKRIIPESEYKVEENGTKIFDEKTGEGRAIREGDKISVHFDIMFRGIDVVSSRAARLLGGNRVIAEPYEFTAGKEVNGVAAKKINDSAGGLFSGMSGPQPPPALSSAVLGMKKGGKRLVMVDSKTLGYGDERVGEMPPGQPFQLKIEILDVL